MHSMQSIHSLRPMNFHRGKIFIMLAIIFGMGITSSSLYAASCSLRQELTARAAGIVQNYLIKNGQHVEKGAVIIEFDDRQLKAAKLEAEAAAEAANVNVALAQDAVNRLKKLRSGESVSHQNVVESNLKHAQALALQKQAEAVLERVKVQLDDTKISATIAGKVLGLPSVIGLAVQPGQSLGRIEGVDPACAQTTPEVAPVPEIKN